MFGLSVWELLIVLAIVLLLFGPRRLKTLGSDLGNAIKGFRSAVSEDEKNKGAEAAHACLKTIVLKQALGRAD